MRNRFIFEEKEDGFALHYRRTEKDWFDIITDLFWILLFLAACAILPFFMLKGGLEWSDLVYLIFPFLLFHLLQSSWPRLSSRTRRLLILNNQTLTIQNSLFKQANHIPVDNIYRLALTENLDSSEDDFFRKSKDFVLEAQVYNSSTKYHILVFKMHKIFGSVDRILEEEAISISESIADYLGCKLNIFFYKQLLIIHLSLQRLQKLPSLFSRYGDSAAFINPLKYNPQRVQSGIEELGGKGLIGKKTNKE